MIEIGCCSAKRLAKSSRSSIWATVVDAVRRRTSSIPIEASHSEL